MRVSKFEFVFGMICCVVDMCGRQRIWEMVTTTALHTDLRTHLFKQFCHVRTTLRRHRIRTRAQTETTHDSERPLPCQRMWMALVGVCVCLRDFIEKPNQCVQPFISIILVIDMINESKVLVRYRWINEQLNSRRRCTTTQIHFRGGFWATRKIFTFHS